MAKAKTWQVPWGGAGVKVVLAPAPLLEDVETSFGEEFTTLSKNSVTAWIAFGKMLPRERAASDFTGFSQLRVQSGVESAGFE